MRWEMKELYVPKTTVGTRLGKLGSGVAILTVKDR
jgi:hypothetical protein